MTITSQGSCRVPGSPNLPLTAPLSSKCAPDTRIQCGSPVDSSLGHSIAFTCNAGMCHDLSQLNAEQPVLVVPIRGRPARVHAQASASLAAIITCSIPHSPPYTGKLPQARHKARGSTGVHKQAERATAGGHVQLPAVQPAQRHRPPQLADWRRAHRRAHARRLRCATHLCMWCGSSR